MTLVAGIDSSTQSCKVLVIEVETGKIVRQGKTPHPEGTEVAPSSWLEAFREASTQAGGLNDVAALAVGGQQLSLIHI